jgi:putative polyhydroxyalkanoate system protein
MASIDINRTHSLGLATAKERVEAVAARLQTKLGITWRWDGDKVAFHADSGVAKGVKGTISVTESNVHTEIDLPFLLKAMKGTITKKVEEELAQLDG